MSLPRGWASTTAAEACTLVQSGGTPKAGFIDKPGIPFLKVYNIVGQEIDFDYRPQFVSKNIHQSELKKSITLPGDVLMNIVGPPLGKVAIVPRTFPEWNANQALAIFRPSDAAISRWIYYFLCGGTSVQSVINDTRGSAGQVNISLSQCRNFELSLPPAAEQRRIVAKLDALTTRLAHARAELKRADTLQRKMRLSALSQVFAKHGDGPRETLDSLCRIGTGSTPKRGDPRYYSGGTIAWVTSGAVNQRLVDKPTEFITDAAIKETNCKVFPAGSLLVALYGEGKTRGKVAKLGIAAATNQALAVLHSFEERVDPQWISLFLEARYQETRDEAAGGVQPNLNLGIIKAIGLPVPPLDEQRAAIIRTSLAFSRADRLEAEAARGRALLDRLESAILAKAFKGELVPQDPNDEPASVLLDRIRTQRTSVSKAKPKPRSARRITA